MQRALHTLHGEDPKIFEDPFALDLAGPVFRWFVQPRPVARLLQRMFPWMMPMVAHHLARSRYVEERLDQLLEQGWKQYVLLGAGMDSFAWRRPDLAGRVAIFEIDHPGTQQRKRRRVRKLGWAEPPNVTYLAVDFEKEGLRQALGRGGFDPRGLALFAWMGVMPYLSEASIRSTLKDVAAVSAPGSEIIFDTLDRASLTKGKASPVGRKMFRAAERMGEPMITGFDAPEIRDLLADSGFDTLEVVTPEQFGERWFRGRSDAPPPWEYVYIVRAGVR